MERKYIHDALRELLGRSLKQSEVDRMEVAIDRSLGIAVTRPKKDKGRQITERGERFIKTFESLELEAYPDPGTGGEPWTIGWGHTGPEVRPGLRITEERAEELFDLDTDRFEAAVVKFAREDTTDAQFDALVSFAFNVGESALKSSTLLRLHNAGKFNEAAAQFLRWNKGGGRVLGGLVRRRKAEMEMYLGE